jgi:hypothetical protein
MVAPVPTAHDLRRCYLIPSRYVTAHTTASTNSRSSPVIVLASHVALHVALFSGRV